MFRKWQLFQKQQHPSPRVDFHAQEATKVVGLEMGKEEQTSAQAARKSTKMSEERGIHKAAMTRCGDRNTAAYNRHHKHVETKLHPTVQLKY